MKTKAVTNISFQAEPSPTKIPEVILSVLDNGRMSDGFVLDAENAILLGTQLIQAAHQVRINGGKL